MELKNKRWAKYIANKRTKELHTISNIKIKCSIKNMNVKNVIYCTSLWGWFLITFRGYNGCYHCNRKHNIH